MLHAWELYKSCVTRADPRSHECPPLSHPAHLVFGVARPCRRHHRAHHFRSVLAYTPEQKKQALRSLIREVSRMRIRPALLLGALLCVLSACSGRSGGERLLPLSGGASGVGVFDAATSQCAVSYDGFVWYTVNAGSFAPIDVAHEQCASDALQAKGTPIIPAWAKPSGPTQTIFVAASLQEKLPLGGMPILENVAQAHHIPVTWLVGSTAYLTDVAPYNAEHAQNGDDVQGEPGFESLLAKDFPWYKPRVLAQIDDGRNPAGPAASMPLGETAFWGITWNNLGVDTLEDYGSPWGSYCADVSSFKRPAPDGSCALLGFEWTARDLDRAYYTGQVASFSTDPDDLLQRAGFTAQTAVPYVDALIDAYAAAGQGQPIAIVSQQESQEMFNAGDPQIMDALYARAVADGMKIETLAQASVDARTFSASPRAVAFPFIAGGKNIASALVGNATVFPSTIDYVDSASGMTFIGGHTLPSRVFRYADYPVSSDGTPMPTVPASQLPSLTNVAAGNGSISFQFNAPAALHYGVALWTDPAMLGITGNGVHPAGRAGVVLTFDLQPGTNQITFACSGCSSTTFPYAT